MLNRGSYTQCSELVYINVQGKRNFESNVIIYLINIYSYNYQLTKQRKMDKKEYT